MPPDPLPPTAVEGQEVAFRRADPEHALAGVRVWCDLDLGADLALGRVAGGWELRLPLPDLDCLEYLFETGPEGETTTETDPGNPVRVDGAFGEHSVLALPGYVPPAWLDEPGVEGEWAPLDPELVGTTPVGPVDVTVWSPAGSTAAADALPLLVAHDGPEIDAYAGLTRYVAAGIAAGRLPAMRVALLSPGARNERYAANPAYAAALVEQVVPAILASHPTSHRPVLSGQSLGASRRCTPRGSRLARSPGCSSSRARSSPPSSTRRSRDSSSGAR